MQMSGSWQPIDEIQAEETQERLKLMWVINRNWPMFLLFSLSMIIWAAMLIGMAAAIFQSRFGFLLTTMLVIWLAVWAWFGRILWRRWQYVAARREILFVYPDRLILRRPISILGITDAYDMQHIHSFYFSDKRDCPVFDYGYQHVFFGQSLSPGTAQQLVMGLNGRYFPHLADA